MEQWEKWEKFCQKELDLDSTISSGNQWNDPGDGINRGHYTEESFPLVIDCKHTTKKSFSLNSNFIKEWFVKAQELGKFFAMPVRFGSPEGNIDCVVLKFDDFLSLIERTSINRK